MMLMLPFWGPPRAGLARPQTAGPRQPEVSTQKPCMAWGWLQVSSLGVAFSGHKAKVWVQNWMCPGDMHHANLAKSRSFGMCDASSCRNNACSSRFNSGASRNQCLPRETSSLSWWRFPDGSDSSSIEALGETPVSSLWIARRDWWRRGKGPENKLLPSQLEHLFHYYWNKIIRELENFPFS
jgi:hypothetical protein